MAEERDDLEARVARMENEISVVTGRLEHTPSWRGLMAGSAALALAIVSAAWVVTQAEASRAVADAKGATAEVRKEVADHKANVSGELRDLRRDMNENAREQQRALDGLVKVIVERRPAPEVRAEMRGD